MNLNRMLYTTSLAAGVGLAGSLGAGVDTADAAPATSTDSGVPTEKSGAQQTAAAPENVADRDIPGGADNR